MSYLRTVVLLNDVKSFDYLEIQYAIGVHTVDLLHWEQCAELSEQHTESEYVWLDTYSVDFLSIPIHLWQLLGRESSESSFL